MPSSLEVVTAFMVEKSITNIVEESQNKEYEGYRFTVDSISYCSRLAKLIPKKKGYFVAFGEKDSKNNNQAYNFSTSPDRTIIMVNDNSKKGLFIFPKEVLKQHQILKTDKQKGKMAIRVYPSWEKDLNPTATKTQRWQATHFLDLSTIE